MPQPPQTPQKAWQMADPMQQPACRADVNSNMQSRLQSCLPENTLEAWPCFPVIMPAKDAMPEAHRAAKPRLLPVKPRKSARKMPAQQASMAAAKLIAMDSVDAAVLTTAMYQLET